MGKETTIKGIIIFLSDGKQIHIENEGRCIECNEGYILMFEDNLFLIKNGECWIEEG